MIWLLCAVSVVLGALLVAVGTVGLFMLCSSALVAAALA